MTETISQLQRAENALSIMRELRINGFQSGTTMNKLNPSFGFRNGDTTNDLRSRGVQSMWAESSAPSIAVRVLPNGYGGKEVVYTFGTPIGYHNGREMTDNQREGVITFLLSLVDEFLQEMKKWQSNPDLDSVVEDIEKWAKEYVAKKDSATRIWLAKGKRQCDGNCDPYYALLLDNGASIPLSQDKNRRLFYRTQAPLCGQSNCSEFNMSNYKEILASAIDWCL